MTTFSCTYSADDNKLRLSASSRLDKDLYERVRAAGFVWAPYQKIFIASAWTPEREDLAVELAGDIDDEDTSLVGRAEERAERFEEYSEHRGAEAESAYKAVERVANGIPFGQPILVGHHSERRARRDKEKIENGMRRTIKLRETSQYWERRAEAALKHAKYLEQPAVRHRRIKGLEADVRRQEKSRTRAVAFLGFWNEPDKELTLARAKSIVNYDHSSVWSKLEAGELTPEAARDIAVPGHEATIRHCDRWLAHLNHRLTYERAMLGEQGGIKADKFAIEVGGQILGRFGWAVVTRVTKKDGRILSATTKEPHFHGGGSYNLVHPIETITDYRAPAAGDAAKVKEATKFGPIVNVRSEGCREMTTAEFKERAKYGNGHARKFPPSDTHGAYRRRVSYRGGQDVWIFLTDAKEVPIPPAPKAAAELPAPSLPDPDDVRRARKPYVAPEPTKFDALRDSLKAGVKVVSAPQLFPTPPELAARMVELAEIESGHDVLEPSAGTGNLVRALAPTGCNTLAVEINIPLARALEALDVPVICEDFLTWSIHAGALFDRIVANPPFADGQDIAHIQRMIEMLKPGGKLVALCANGPRQQAQLRPLVDTWEDLPEGSFATSGTGVRVALVTYRAVA